jgi:hypothetical protein
MSLRPTIAIVVVLLMIVPPALTAASFKEDSAGECTGPRAFDPWWDYGWNFRRPVTIDNTANAGGLVNYQLLMNITYDSDMRPDFADLRFAQYNQTLGQAVALPYWIESKADGTNASVWVNVSSIAAQGTSTIHMYYGNPSANSGSNGTLAFDFFDDFENSTLKGGWTFWNPGGDDSYSLTERPGWLRIKVVGDSDTFDFVNAAPFMYWAHPTPNTNFVVQTKEDGTGVSTTNRHSLLAYIISLNMGRENKGYWGAYSSTTSCKFEADGFRGIVGNTGAVIHDLRFRKVDSSLYYDWSLDRMSWTNTGSYTLLSTPIYWGLGGKSWGGGGGFNADFDYFIVRKSISPEPTYAIGPEELPFKFISMTHSPAKMNIGDTVFFNATFNNPTLETIKIQLAAREADAFNDTPDYFFQDEVKLAASSDTAFPFNWTAVGGSHTIWLAVFGHPFASVKIKVNRDPVLAPVKDQSLLQDREFLLQLNASDPDGDKLDWYIDNPLLNLTPSSNRSSRISFLPTNDDIGIHRANITVKDPMNRTASIRMNFTVNNVNDPPTLEKIPSLSATQYKELRYKVNATDPDSKWGDVLSYGDNTDLFDIDERTGVFFFTPTEEHVGKHNVKVTVTDKEGVSETGSFTITVANANDPPTLEILPPQFTLQGRAFQLKVAAADPDLKSDPTEKLRFSDDCPLFNINNDTGMISFTPSNDEVGVWKAKITVTDRGGLTNTTALTITVMNANDPPTMDAIPAQTATEEQPFQYQCVAADPDMKWGLDNLTFSDDTELFNIDPKTGAIAFTPTGGQEGIRRVTITVKDEDGAQVSASFDLSVVHVNHPPFDVAIRFPSDGARLKEGDQMWLDGTGKDSDKGDTLRYSWRDNENPIGTGKNISVNLKPGKHTIRLEVSDGTEMVISEVSVEVTKKEVITVAGSGDWTMMAGAAVAVVAVLAILGVLATRRRSKPAREEPSDGSRVSSIPEGDTVALPPVPPAEAAAQDHGSDEDARMIIDSAVDRLSDYQEAHPEEALDVGPVMEKLDIARGFLESGEYEDALAFAMEADATVSKMTQPHAPKRVAVKKKKAIAGKTACPGCGEELQPGWPACPVCGEKTR